MKADAIIVASTFMYKDQVRIFLDAFNQEGFPKKKIFVYQVVRTLNEWSVPGWRGEKEIWKGIVNLVEKGWEIFTFFEDYEKDREILDDLNLLRKDDQKRSPYNYLPVKFSKEDELFYIEHKYYDLQSVKDDKAEREEKDK